MKLAFCLFKYFPFGGLQRDFIRIARACIARGHAIDVYTMQWEGEREAGLNIHLLPMKGMQNHTRRENFVRQLQANLARENYDLVVGFNKMRGLDVYYAADTCYRAKAQRLRGFFYRLTSRYRCSVEFERAVFSSEAKTEILLLSENQRREFSEHYQTSDSRFHLLPPGIDRDRIAPPDAQDIRAEVRKKYQIAEKDYLILMVGSGFRTKGLDRALIAFAALPESLRQRTQLFVIGKDNASAFERQAQQLGIAARIKFLGGRDDVPQFLLAADVLLHPAYNENTGTVLLEALAAGLPVLATDVCGYAHYVRQARAGVVLDSPFRQATLNHTLAEMLLSPEQSQRQKNAIEFAKTADIYSLPERAASIIESVGCAL